MSNMAEVNGTDHLVRHEKETKLNGYDNEGFHSQERSEDGDESASDDDRLRIVITENGHRPENDPHLHNGYAHEESNGHSTSANGVAVIVLEEGKGKSNMDDNKVESSPKPLDTRLHHYVPVDDIDKKILNGSDGTHVTIPEDAVISFTTGRVKVKKGTSNNPQTTNDRESIPLETMLPSYEAEDKIGLGEKAELEAELTNHKNGLWSEGPNAYANPEGPFSNSEKLNGTSKSNDEVSLPVNNHRKCLSGEVSDTSSEQKSTGEKLYFTEDNRKLCPGWRRVFVCGLILIILAVALLLGVLAATGILLAESESKTTRYESGHSLASIDSITHAGISGLPPNVPPKFKPTKVTERPPNATTSWMVDTVSQPPPSTVSSKVPLLNDTSHSQTIVPNALVGEFTITDENFTDDLKDKSSHGYTSLSSDLEGELRKIFKRSGGIFQDLKILNFSPGSIKVKFVTIWSSDRNIILSGKAEEILKSYLRRKHNLLLAFPVDPNSINFIDVFDECRVQKGGCSYKCNWDYNRLLKTCTCEDHMMLLEDGKSCGPIPSTSYSEVTTTTLRDNLKAHSTISTTKLSRESPETTAGQTEDSTTTHQNPAFLSSTIASIMDIFKDLITTESPVDIEETISSIQNVVKVTESLPEDVETTTKASNSEQPTTTHNIKINYSEVLKEITTAMPTTVNNSFFEDIDAHNIFMNDNTTEIFSTISNLSEAVTTYQPEFETIHDETTSTSNDQFWNVSTLTTQSQTTVHEYFEANETITEASGTHVTSPSEEETVTTIGYHIKEGTTETYTLKEDTDFATETIVTTVNPLNVTQNFMISTDSTPEVAFTTSNAETVIDEHITEPNIPSKVPEHLTEIIPNTTTYEASELTTTEKMKYETITEVPNVSVTIIADNLNQNSTVRDTADQHITTMPSLNVGTEYDNVTHYDFTETEAAYTTSKPLLNENDIEETATATISDSTTTTFTSPSIVKHLNRTPEVRSFDNITDFTENNTFTPEGFLLYTDTTIHDASTEVNTYVNDSISTKLDVEAVLTSSPLPTTTDSLEHIPDTGTTVTNNHSTLFDGIADSETTTNYVTELNTEMKQMTNTEITITPVPESTIASSNISLGDKEIATSTEIPLESITENFHDVHTVMNDTGNTNVFDNETEVTTLLPIPNEPFNETTEFLENTETTLKENGNGNITENYTTEVNTLLPFNNSENGSLEGMTSDTETTHILPSSEIIMDLKNETTTTDFPELNVSNDKSMINMTTDETGTIFESESSNSTEIFTSVVNPVFDLATLEPKNQTIFENDSTTVTVTTDSTFELNISYPEIIENMTFVENKNSSDYNETSEAFTLTTLQDFTFPTPTYFNESEDNSTMVPFIEVDMLTTVEYNNDTTFPEEMLNDSNVTDVTYMFHGNSSEGMPSTLIDDFNGTTLENGTDIEGMINFTTYGYDDVTNETTTNASTGVDCREDQFLCEPLNKCINDTFMCDGIQDCPDGQDEFECKDSCHSNFMCSNSSTCIMSDARCDGIWDCENGSDEENCTPTECSKHEVMCSDGSKCIKPGQICDWKYNCRDRSDEVGCVERTTCESGGRFFCNDGLCIPWSLKCDGEFDCKEGEDEGNCTCLNDEFQCNDGKCLKSSSRCDGHQDCHDAGDEMGCVTVDSEHIISTYEPYSGTWALLCAENWDLDDGQYLCQELGFGHAINIDRVHVSFNGTWMAMRRDSNLTEISLWTERVSFVESCTSSQAAIVECQKFVCGEYSGLLHRRRRDVVGSSSSQWPFIGYASTFQSNKGCLSEILTPIWLITSAECLLSISKQPFNGSEWYVKTSIGNDEDEDMALNHEVLRIISHPHSSKFRSLTLRDYDVALIRLKHALVFKPDKVGAICPPEEQVPPGITCFSRVLGTEKPRAPPPTTLAINSLALQIIDKESCNRVEHYNGTVNQRMLCTQSSEGHTICDNDEGTPLMCLTGINKWFLAGMLTYQRFCDVYSKHPAIFSNLFSMRKFLDQVTGQKHYEVPYDSSIYVIIPPTTPSPTLPETTTVAITTESTLLDTTYLTTMESENVTETTYEVAEETNDTTPIIDELREETDTVLPPVEYATELYNFTADDMQGNITVTSHYGRDFDLINTTVEDTEKETEDFLSNKTHNYLIMSQPNNLYTESIFNVTGIPVLDDNSTDFPYLTLPELETTTTVPDFSNVPLTSETQNDVNETTEIMSSGSDLTTVTSIGETNVTVNETSDSLTTVLPAVLLANETVLGNQPLILSLDGVTDSSPLVSDSNETVNNQPSLSIFNETLERLQPMISISNKSLSLYEPMVSISNASSRMYEPVLSISNESLGMYEPPVPILNESSGISQPLVSFSNESSDISEPVTTIAYESIDTNEPLNSVSSGSVEVSQPLISVSNDTIALSQPLTSFSNESIAISQPLTSFSNESIAVSQPFTSVVNESIAVSQPLTLLLLNDTTEREDENITTVSPLRFTVISKANESELFITTMDSLLTEDGNTTYITQPATETTISNIEMTPKETDSEMTSPISSFEGGTETFTFIMDGEPDADLEFSIFGNPDGLKFEPYVLSEKNNTTEEDIQITEKPINTTTDSPLATEKNNTDNSSEEYTPVTEKLINTATDSPLTTTAVPFTTSGIDSAFTEYITNSTELHSFLSDTSTENVKNEREDRKFDKTSLENFETEITTETVLESTLLHAALIGDNTTLMLEVDNKTYAPEAEKSTVKPDFISEEFFDFQDNIMLSNSAECGIWDENSGSVNSSENESYIMQWPALGYLQMNSESKLCASAIVSPKYVVTSLTCLTLRDDQLNPDKWTYVGGYTNISTGEIQNRSVSKIIRYPDQSTSVLFNKYDVALVRLENTVHMNNYSKTVCLPENDLLPNQQCFTTGWSKNSSDHFENQFHSIPMTIISTEDCNSTMNYNGKLLNSLFCGSQSSESVHMCQMDIGSPLFCLNKNRHWEIQGILNFPGSCEILTQPAVYSSVKNIRNWILDTLTNDDRPQE